MHLHLAGHLAWYDARKRAHREIHLTEPTRLLVLLQQLGVPTAEVAIAAVNGTLVSLEDTCVSDSDRVELFPPVGGGSKVQGSPLGMALRTLNLELNSQEEVDVRTPSPVRSTRDRATPTRL